MKVEAESASAILGAVQAINVMRQEDQIRFKYLTKEARANWISLGLFAGMFLDTMLSQFPWWADLIAAAGAVGVVQGMSRYPWKFRGKAKPSV